MERLDLTSLRNAISSLKDATDSYTTLSNYPGLSQKELNTVKSGVIQNFEVAYEQCWKFMKRWIEENISSVIADGVTRKELFRLAAESRLIKNVELWFEYHHARNLSSHTYNENHADKVFSAAFSFYNSASDFLANIEMRND